MDASVGFLLFSPDSTVTRLYNNACLWLEQQNIRFLAFSWARLRSEDVQQLYLKNRMGRAAVPEDRLVDELFSLGYSLGVLACLGSSCIREESIYSYITALKGPSSPRKTKPENLRWHLGATNKILNFVHSSDDSLSASKEAAICFPIETLETIQPKNTSSVSIPKPPADLDFLKSISGPQIFLQIKTQLAKSAVVLPPTFFSCLNAELEIIEKSRQVLVYYSELRAVYRTQLQILSARENALDSTITTLAKFIRWTLGQRGLYADGTALIHDLRKAGYTPTRWEELVLMCEGLA